MGLLRDLPVSSVVTKYTVELEPFFWKVHVNETFLINRAGSVGSVDGLVEVDVDFLDEPLHAAMVASNKTEAKRMTEMYTNQRRFDTGRPNRGNRARQRAACAGTEVG